MFNNKCAKSGYEHSSDQYMYRYSIETGNDKPPKAWNNEWVCYCL